MFQKYSKTVYSYHQNPEKSINIQPSLGRRKGSAFLFSKEKRSPTLSCKSCRRRLGLLGNLKELKEHLGARSVEIETSNLSNYHSSSIIFTLNISYQFISYHIISYHIIYLSYNLSSIYPLPYLHL